ncbi:hypothetical protein DDI_0625 [Dickeya dianthicola RNS04.9]|nr:hypothetical protein DDI_0625 [Dickeya dianthicola RNS04.9]
MPRRCHRGHQDMGHQSSLLIIIGVRIQTQCECAHQTSCTGDIRSQRNRYRLPVTHSALCRQSVCRLIC